MSRPESPLRPSKSAQAREVPFASVTRVGARKSIHRGVTLGSVRDLTKRDSTAAAAIETTKKTTTLSGAAKVRTHSIRNT